jgi:steroid delta-isomerase-like uncharacterized protein
VSTDANKAVLRRFDEEVWNAGHLEVMDELFAPDYVNHDPSLGQTGDREGHKRTIALARAALPDVRETVEDLVAEGDRVAFRWTIRATHLGELFGTQPTGNAVHIGGIEIYRLRDERIVERWGVFDRLGLMQQLGIVPRR